MTAASCKVDDGRSCFPARTLLRQRRDGGSHWLVAYRKSEEQGYSDVYRRIKEPHEHRERSRATGTGHGNILDGPLLLRLHCVDEPFELCSVVISEQRLNSVRAEDLKAFNNVAYIDASVNLLSLGSFSSFVSLRELNLSLNSICNMIFDASDFPHLEVLDLSYNQLSADDIVSISWLPRLKVLHLTGNQLHRLPPNLQCASGDLTPPLGTEEDTQFRALEVLMLDDNKLSSGVFSCLRNLRRLKYLNLQRNHISEVSVVQLMGCLKASQTSTGYQAEEERHAHSEPDPNSGEHFKRLWQALRENMKEHYDGSGLPLPELQVLNLSNNKIADEEALMAVAFFPTLHELDIHSNPLTTQRSGDPPLLTHYLRDRLGITIKRTKQTKGVVKPLLKVSTDPKWKVEEKFPQKQFLVKRETEVTVRRTPECEDGNSRDASFQENTQHFFVTQAADASEHEFDLRAAERETAENEPRNEDDSVPEKFGGYKTLMGAKPDPDVVESIGIQTAVRMLEHKLKSLNVYRDSEPKCDGIQMPYREKEKRIKEFPPLKPVKLPAERVDEMLSEIKESTAMREVALSSVLRDTATDQQEYQEVLALLRDMKTKYKTVYRKTMEQAAKIDSDRNANLNGSHPLPAPML